MIRETIIIIPPNSKKFRFSSPSHSNLTISHQPLFFSLPLSQFQPTRRPNHSFSYFSGFWSVCRTLEPFQKSYTLPSTNLLNVKSNVDGVFVERRRTETTNRFQKSFTCFLHVRTFQIIECRSFSLRSSF